MPTKKQRRRQQKSRRHDYEYVYVDDEGNEVAVDPAEARTEKETAKAEARARQGSRDGRSPARTRSQRGIEPPSWRRAAKRGLIFGPILVVAMVLLNGKHATLAEQVAPALFLVAFFIPFSYFTDSIAYRMYRKRVDRREAAKTR